MGNLLAGLPYIILFSGFASLFAGLLIPNPYSGIMIIGGAIMFVIGLLWAMTVHVKRSTE